MSNMLTPREFAALVDYGYANQKPAADSLRVVWDYDIIGVKIRAQQNFATAPCVYELSAEDAEGNTRWNVVASFERATNTPHTLFSQYVDDENVAMIFNVMWKCVWLPVLEYGDYNLFTNDLLMLRMASDLWSL